MQWSHLPAPATTIFILGKSIIGLPCALTAPRSPAIATPAVPCEENSLCIKPDGFMIQIINVSPIKDIV